MTMSSRLTLLLVLWLLSTAFQQQHALSSSDKPPRSSRCRMDYTSLALLSCQETSPKTPMKSCCSALLYAIDTAPAGYAEAEDGICCLCRYLALKKPRFDLAGSYVSCHGKEENSVRNWTQFLAGAPVNNCTAQCEAAAAPTRSGKKKKKKKLMKTIILTVVVVWLFPVGFLIYCIFRKPAAKERTSPDPSNHTAIGQGDGDGSEMMTSPPARSSSSLLPALMMQDVAESALAKRL
ncbi:hypothetical protein QOZ80_5BG0409560 [Eleusine coracana subsp. coracana]|nr:hypothetical protein QOZ80_5BG0409560 [Eleusine coracana subsp. coracana]